MMPANAYASSILNDQERKVGKAGLTLRFQAKRQSVRKVPAATMLSLVRVRARRRPTSIGFT